MKGSNTLFFASSNELVKTSVKDLKVGMYVAKLDKPWLETTFLYQGFELKNQADINAVCEQCSFVFIDVKKQNTSHTFEFLANNSPPEKWKRRTLAVNLSTIQSLGLAMMLSKRPPIIGNYAWSGLKIMQLTRT